MSLLIKRIQPPSSALLPRHYIVDGVPCVDHYSTVEYSFKSLLPEIYWKLTSKSLIPCQFDPLFTFYYFVFCLPRKFIFLCPEFKCVKFSLNFTETQLSGLSWLFSFRSNATRMAAVQMKVKCGASQRLNWRGWVWCRTLRRGLSLWLFWRSSPLTRSRGSFGTASLERTDSLQESLAKVRTKNHRNAGPLVHFYDL